MTTFIRPRLRVPALYVLTGAALAAAFVAHGGGIWYGSIATGIGFGARAIRAYVTGGRDSDEGALAGSRADERLALLRTRSRALAGIAAAVAAFIGLTAGIAVRAAWWWPFALILAIALMAYLFGWSQYGIGATDPADDEAGVTQPAQSPAT
ncbi:MAG TPA: hypothetical protein VGG35_14490 [Streptosporangiaceae bacterium]|jgi:hypothetical protein